MRYKMVAGNCADCGQYYSYLQKAHIIAKHKGGSNEPENIVLICPNCHHVRDRDDRVAWAKKRWESIPYEERSDTVRKQMAALTTEQKEMRGKKISKSKTGKPSPLKGRKTGVTIQLTSEQKNQKSEAIKAGMNALTPEQKEERARKISVSKIGKKHPEGRKTGGARQFTPEQITKRNESVKAAWADKTPEELAEHARKISETKQKQIAEGKILGNIENLKKGWEPEIRAKAVKISAELRLGTKQSEETKAKTSATLKQTYAEGRHKRGHSEETKQKISETKKKQAIEKREERAVKEFRANSHEWFIKSKEYKI